MDQNATLLNSIMGKTVAIVYIFEGDDSPGLDHFYSWKSNIIAGWMEAVQKLNGLPLILDVRTFVDKAINNTLPHVDYVLNLNSGTYLLSSMALVPSVCSAMNLPCIPCDATSIVTGEEKNISNHIAMGIGLNVPSYLPKSNPNGIFRPMSMGNSKGVIIGRAPEGQAGVYQEFIPGYDITTPVVYNPLLKRMDVLPSVVFYPKEDNPQWYYDENSKSAQSGYDFKLVKMSERLKEKYIELTEIMGVRNFCRIDARVKNFSEQNGELYADFDDTYFVEINVMPTVRNKNSFNYSYENISENDTIFPFVETLKQTTSDSSLNTFLLAVSMLEHTKTTC